MGLACILLGRIVLIVLTLATLVQVSGDLEKIAVCILVAGVFSARIALRGSSYLNFGVSAVAMLLTLAPWTGALTLQAFSLAFFVFKGRRYELADSRSSQAPLSDLVWIAPFAGYLFGNLLSETAIGALSNVDASGSLLSGVPIDSWARVVDLGRSFLDTRAVSWMALTRVVLLALWVSVISDNKSLQRMFVRWLSIGASISACFVLSQWLGRLILGAAPMSLPNQTSLWDSLGRLSGLASDPNALGVVLGLSLWVFSLTGTRVLPIALATILAAGVVSGSRTFLLTVGILAIVSIWRRAKPMAILCAACSIVALMCVVTYLDGSAGPLESLLQSNWLPPGVKRGVSALSLLRLEETFSSRSIFVNFARSIGDGHWIFGVGADRFIDYSALAGAKLDLARGWRDNSNNFYLGLLTELGVSGVVFFGFALVGRRLRRDGNYSLNRAALLMLGVIGCTGPHTDFTEALILVSAIVAIASEPRRVASGAYVFVALCAVTLGIFAARRHEHGVYGWTASDSTASRWLSHSAEIELKCGVNPESRASEAELILQPRYIPQSGPLLVKYSDALSRSAENAAELRMTSGDPQRVLIKCDVNESTKRVKVQTSPAWSPYRAWPGTYKDRRVLGVEQVEVGR
jgi:hypothetical protein